MPNTRVKELMEMLEYETDPDKIQILEFDLAEATGGKDKGMRKGVKKRVDGGSPMTDSQKKFAALAEPKDKITFADRIAGATKKNNKAFPSEGENLHSACITPTRVVLRALPLNTHRTYELLLFTSNDNALI